MCHVETFHLYFPEIYYECNKNNQLENAKHFCPTITFRQKIQGRTKISILTTHLFIGTHLNLRRFISFCFKCTCIAKNEILANISWNYRYIYKNQNWSQIVLGTIESIDWPVGLRFLHISHVINVNIQK